MKLDEFRTLATQEGADTTMQTFPVATFVGPTGLAITVELPYPDTDLVPDLDVVTALHTAAQAARKLGK